MAKSHDFELLGLKELEEDLRKVLKKYPDETDKEIYRLAGVFTKDVNKKMNFTKHDGKRNPKKEWHRNRITGFGGATVAYEIRNSAPHFHLLENGHVVKAVPERVAALFNGRLDHSKSKGRKAKSRSKNPALKVLGFAPGGHYTERTVKEWDDKFPAKMREFVDKLLDQQNL